ncbi:hypothetical protein ONZ45_g710 [Pleurotus djamor]|nr:hypothetical protein ONZ45_g710 [Pleurotus djamor]
MPIEEEDWSDSDEAAENETSVLLGVPDGSIENPADLFDAAVSRIGGRPAFLPSKEPPFDSSMCKVCNSAMELVVQMWCPFENSPMDRALYVWACARAKCQSKDGSVRAWRGLRFNERYAAKLKQKLARAQERERQKSLAKAAAEERRAPKANPFALGAPQSGANPFGFGDQIFGNPPVKSVPDSASQPEEEEEESDVESDTSDASEESLLTALASTTLEDSSWLSAPSYLPLYLSTTSEYLPPPPKPKLPSGVLVEDGSSPPRGSKGKDEPWTSESYENSLDIDQVFDRFNKRVSYEAQQCVRYELNGSPLPFASGPVFDLLYPSPPAPALPVTKAAFTVVPPARRTYTAESVPACPQCKSPRVFECQLMPNLINILKPNSPESGEPLMKGLTDEERVRMLRDSLKDKDAEVKRGMEWGTCLIFSCGKDCRGGPGAEEAKDVWQEEIVLVQWDT